MKSKALNGFQVSGILVLLMSSNFTYAHPGHHDTPPQQALPIPPQSPEDNPSSLPMSYGDSFKKVYAFGDSFTDTGNAQLLGNLQSFVGNMMSNMAKILPGPNHDHSSHFPSNLFKKMSGPNDHDHTSHFPGNLLRSGNLPGSRLSNGRLVIDFLCQSLGLPVLPAYKDATANFSIGANFAIAGSSALPNTFYTAHKILNTFMFKAIPLTIQTQIDWFTKFMNEIECKGKTDFDCTASMNNSLFWVGELGGNDYTRMLGSSLQIPLLTKMTIGHVHNLVKTLIGKGAKYIVVQGLPPIGCCPLSLAINRLLDLDDMGCSSIANALIKAHNKLLQWKLAKLRMLFPHCTITFVDTWNAYKTILSNPKKFNFQEPFKACCGAGGGDLNFDANCLCGSEGTTTCENPSQFISWDGVHFTEAMHKTLANLFFNVQGFSQPSFIDLIKQKKGLR